MTHRLGRAVPVTLVLVAATALVAVGVAGAQSPGAASISVPDAQTNGSGNASDRVTVSVGAQLSTVIETRSQEVRIDVENADFAFEFESGDPAAAVADRAEELREDAADVREEYRELAAEFEAGEISREEFARRIATLSDRAARINASLEQVRSRAETLAEEEQTRVGFDETEIRRIAGTLENASGAGPRALLERFTGHSTGEVELRHANGLRIEVESEDGERSREVRRPGDDSLDLTISQGTALETARERLSTDVGNWTLVEASIHEDDGEYRFEFELRTATLTGESEVRVDGSAGEVVRFEEELEPRDVDDEDEREVDVETPEDETETPEPSETPESTMDLSVTNGTAGPGETITVSVEIGGSPAADVPVEVNGDVVGRTAADGTLTVTLPDAEDVRIRAETDDHDDELRFEFEDD